MIVKFGMLAKKKSLIFCLLHTRGVGMGEPIQNFPHNLKKKAIFLRNIVEMEKIFIILENLKTRGAAT